MSRWTDIAPWVGPSPNKTAGGLKFDNVRGVVIHIASGFYQGTIAWQRNPDANVSSHFIVGRDGSVVQMVDTADASWAQKSGNGSWLSIENEGFAVDDGLHSSHPGWESLTPQQIEANARIFAKAHQVHGAKVPLQLATSPAGRGLGHHSMGAENGYDWGHSQCPGSPIKSQKPAILARAIQIVNGDPEMADADSSWLTGIPASAGNAGFVGYSRQSALSFAWQHAYNASQKADQLLAAAASDQTRDAALLAAVQALTVATGMDPQPILDAIAAAAADTNAVVTQVQQRLADVQARNVKLAQALAAAGGALDAADD